MFSADSKQTCTVDGNTVAFLRCGKGEPILLVHGITTYSFIWMPLIHLLKGDYEIIAVDLLGCGDSDKTVGASLSIGSHATRLVAFMDQLGIRRFHLVGHDVGGGIAQLMALDHPDRLFDLTLINTVGYDYWPVQPISAIRTPIIRQIAMAALDIGMLRVLVSRGLFHHERLTSEIMAEFSAPMRTRQGRKAFMRFAASLDHDELMAREETIRQLSLPVLLLRGEADVYLSSAIMDRLHKNLPDSTLVSIASGGHFIQFDAPEELVRAITSFYEEHAE